MTRYDDVYLTLQDRSNFANGNKADVFLSIHLNSGGGTGIETYRNGTHQSANSTRLATAVQSNVIQETGARDRGVKTAGFYVIKHTRMPSALLETGFVDHASDARLLKQASYRQKIAVGASKGIQEYLR